jgi:hypothetical protein
MAQEWTDMTETELNTHDRTKEDATLNAAQNNNPLTDDEDRFRIVTRNPNNFSGVLYDNFIDCHRYLQAKKEEQEAADQNNNNRLLQTVDRLSQ